MNNSFKSTNPNTLLGSKITWNKNKHFFYLMNILLFIWCIMKCAFCVKTEQNVKVWKKKRLNYVLNFL